MDRFPNFRAIKYCDFHAKEHGNDVEMETAFIDNSPKFEATDADIEKVATYLLKGRVSNVDEVSKELGMKGIIVASQSRSYLKKGS